MKSFILLAALFFSAIVATADAQIATSDPSGVPVPTPTPELSSDRDGPDIRKSYVRPDRKTRFKRYVNGTVGPISLARQVFNAGLSTARNSPEEWGGQWEGFGKRLASNFGKNIIKRTTIYGLDEALKLDSHYYRSEKKDASSKIKNALLGPVTARNSRGKRVIGIPRLVGTYSSSIIAAETWYPEGYDWKDGVRNGSISLGFNAAYNLFKEFVWKK
jgi:hypothetical protein